MSLSTTLLRVKRKRAESPLESLLLTGQPVKRTAIDDLRDQLLTSSIDRLIDDQKPETQPVKPSESQSIKQATEQSNEQSTSQPINQSNEQSSNPSKLVRVYKLVTTVNARSDRPDKDLIDRLGKPPINQSIKQTTTQSIHQSAARAREQTKERQQAARDEKIALARQNTQSNDTTADQSISQSINQSTDLPRPFHFLDVSIARPGDQSINQSAEVRRVNKLSSSIRALAPAINSTALTTNTSISQLANPSNNQSINQSISQRDTLFADAMKVVKAMPDKSRMTAYASLLDDYWSTVSDDQPVDQSTNQSINQSMTFTQEVQSRTSNQMRTMEMSSQHIDVMRGIAPTQRQPRQSTNQSTNQSINQSMDQSTDDDVYDVYELVEEGDSSINQSISYPESGAVIIDNRVAGWFGLVENQSIDDEFDSDEDEEDENRESHEANDYPDEEDEDSNSDDSTNQSNNSDSENTQRWHPDDENDRLIDDEEALEEYKQALKNAAPFRSQSVKEKTERMQHDYDDSSEGEEQDYWSSEEEQVD